MQKNYIVEIKFTAWKVSKYGVFSGPNAGKYGPEKTHYLHTFHAVIGAMIVYDLRDSRLKKSQF